MNNNSPWLTGHRSPNTQPLPFPRDDGPRVPASPSSQLSVPELRVVTHLCIMLGYGSYSLETCGSHAAPCVSGSGPGHLHGCSPHAGSVTDERAVWPSPRTLGQGAAHHPAFPSGPIREGNVNAVCGWGPLGPEALGSRLYLPSPSWCEHAPSAKDCQLRDGDSSLQRLGCGGVEKNLPQTILITILSLCISLQDETLVLTDIMLICMKSPFLWVSDS